MEKKNILKVVIGIEAIMIMALLVMLSINKSNYDDYVYRKESYYNTYLRNHNIEMINVRNSLELYREKLLQDDNKKIYKQVIIQFADSIYYYNYVSTFSEQGKGNFEVERILNSYYVNMNYYYEQILMQENIDIQEFETVINDIIIIGDWYVNNKVIEENQLISYDAFVNEIYPQLLSRDKEQFFREIED